MHFCSNINDHFPGINLLYGDTYGIYSVLGGVLDCGCNFCEPTSYIWPIYNVIISFSNKM